MSEWPSVCVVVPTRDRPALLDRCVAAILEQDYAGRLTVTVVVDQSDPADAVPASVHDDARVTVVRNERTPGLSGARNTGIVGTDADYVAFCDDDDIWLPGKLTGQVGALRKRPGSTFASCSIEVDYDGKRSVRLAGSDTVTYADLLPSRMAMLHSSTFLIDRRALVEDIGLLDEEVPVSQNEDWDLLLRAAARGPIVHVDEPLVRVHWSARSYFARDWETKISSLEWMLARHPDIAAHRVGSARVYGQIAFAYAALGRRRTASRWALRSIRSSWHEPRAYIALATAAGLSSSFVLDTLHKRGHGV